uniref:Transmembrane protein n=1 Tax=Eimeria tenella TaxID=5802 RepID=H9B9Z4_EIMTE|nr:hypothetical protein [Eimeria tenella]
MMSPQAGALDTVEWRTVTEDAPLQDLRTVPRKRRGTHRVLRVPLVALVGLAVALSIFSSARLVGLQRSVGVHAWWRLRELVLKGYFSEEGEAKAGNQRQTAPPAGPRKIPSTANTRGEESSGRLQQKPPKDVQLSPEAEKSKKEEVPSAEPTPTSALATGPAEPVPSTSSGPVALPSAPRAEEEKKQLERMPSTSGTSPSSAAQTGAPVVILGKELIDALAHEMAGSVPVVAQMKKVDAVKVASSNALYYARLAKPNASKSTMDSFARLLHDLSQRFTNESNTASALLASPDVNLEQDAIQQKLNELFSARNEMSPVYEFLKSCAKGAGQPVPESSLSSSMQENVLNHITFLQLALDNAESLLEEFIESHSGASRDKLQGAVEMMSSVEEQTGLLLQWLLENNQEAATEVIHSYEDDAKSFVKYARDTLARESETSESSELPLEPRAPSPTERFTSDHVVIQSLLESTAALRKTLSESAGNVSVGVRSQLEAQISDGTPLIEDAQQAITESDIAQHLVAEVIQCICGLADAIDDARKTLEKSKT